jgi:hypothetical protein
LVDEIQIMMKKTPLGIKKEHLVLFFISGGNELRLVFYKLRL